MGFFKNIQENMRMAKYLRVYDTLPTAVKSFYTEDEFVAEISNVWDLQKTYEAIKWPPGWPFGSAEEIPDLAQCIEWARSEGATDEDIAWWWNLSPIDRIIIKGTDKADKDFRMATVINSTNKEIKPEEVMEKIKRAFVIYIEEQPDLSIMTVDDKEYFLSEDRPFPFELHNRISIYLKNNSDPSNLSIMKKEAEEYSSFNAFIRKKINNKYKSEEDEIEIKDIPF